MACAHCMFFSDSGRQPSKDARRAVGQEALIEHPTYRQGFLPSLLQYLKKEVVVHRVGKRRKVS